MKIDTNLSTLIAEKNSMEAAAIDEDLLTLFGEENNLKDIRKLSFYGKQKLLRAVVDKVIIDKDVVEIKWL